MCWVQNLASQNDSTRILGPDSPHDRSIYLSVHSSPKRDLSRRVQPARRF